MALVGSPDSSEDWSYGQTDTNAAKDFLLIIIQITLYPTHKGVPYPKVRQENGAARIGVVTLDSAKPVDKAPGIAKDMYVLAWTGLNNNKQLLVQQFNRKQDTITLFLCRRT